MLVLGIESTCDETGCAIVDAGKEILANTISSQIDLHNQYGGVVPELACRRHIDVIIPLLDQALQIAGKSLEEIDLIAAARGPGLIGALLIGLTVAKTLAFVLNKPLIGVNHIEAHLYGAVMSQHTPIRYPCLGVIISGGHTSLLLMHDVGHYQSISQTADDALGEAFDKVAKIMGLPYPGGPIIEQLASQGNPKRYPFRAGQVKGRPLDFSFSGLKTGVLYAVKGTGGNRGTTVILSEEDKKDVAASFQEAAFQDLVSKSLRAAEQYHCRSLLFGGGVANNQRLRHLFMEATPLLPCYWPIPALTLDNAAMIAGLGYHRYRLQGIGDPLDLDALPRIAIT